MSLEILQDPRVRSVPWKDLRRLSWQERILELGIWVPWWAASWWAAWSGVWVLALGLSFVFFLAGLRLVHDIFHGNLGLPRWADDLVMFVMSLLMLGSMHAVQFNHLRHHRHCMGEEDIEAKSATMPAWKAILWGPVFPILLHKAALTLGRRRVKLWVMLELMATGGILALAWFGPWQVLRYHVVAMLIGQCLTAFFAVWTVHHDCDQSHFIARTLRGKWQTFLTMNMFYHVEHHLFPALPTRRLPLLAERLDQAAPELKQKQVF